MSDLELINTFASKISQAGGAIAPISSAPWVEDIEAQLGYSLPKLYRLFLQKYSFAPFEIVGVEFFGNTGDSTEDEDIYSRMFLDKGLAGALISNRFVHFARPEDGSYDPICISLPPHSSKDGSVVRIDHEAILCFNKIKIRQTLFPRFKDLIQAALDA